MHPNSTLTNYHFFTLRKVLKCINVKFLYYCLSWIYSPIPPDNKKKRSASSEALPVFHGTSVVSSTPVTYPVS